MPSWRKYLTSSLNAASSPVLASLGKDNTPQVRMLQFRGFIGDRSSTGQRCVSHDEDEQEECLLRFATDLRSEKIPGLLKDPRVELCWWFPETQEQYRLRGLAHLVLPSTTEMEQEKGHHWPLSDISPDKERLVAWRHCVSPASKLLWTWPHPGHGPRASPDSFPDHWQDDMEPQALANFVLCAIQVQRVDLVDLSVRPPDHRIWGKTADQTWEEEEVNP
ncbi:hypothetical protein BJ684DRAFT_20040 [Piptocephalis cylindrospora]|uniref:Pyridoxamine 5'-phosphate oxidase Alr4036 family FMN-binding domain-containing protein n=1 Tax=Piptocephalis cylindrospora TaxID=1907219 RepID=A0A4P9Y5L5_9FUNG|nr:hypothetical protein BJ684DRAFT_20040 [Piptocephalis cylindrospora]|eukprot:RKP13481.1 hypothetical protein BJ684DRAFT_20040 [Piptocephalis cylindrospora]